MDSNHRRLDVGQESLPLDHGTLIVGKSSVSLCSRGGNRTHKLSPGSRPGRFTCLRTRPSNCGGRIRTGVVRHMRPCWKPSPVHSAVTKGRVELPRRLWLDVLSVACLPVPPLGQSSTGGNRTHTHHQGLSLAALPVCVPCQQTSSMRFELMTSTVTGWRALQAAPRGQDLFSFSSSIADSAILDFLC